MFRKASFASLLGLVLLFFPGTGNAQLLAPAQGFGSTGQVTVGTTTLDITFPSATLRSAQDRLQEILYYLRTFDSYEEIPVPAAASTTTPDTSSNIYSDITNYAFEVEEDTSSAINSIQALANSGKCHVFINNFEIGSTDPEVLEIQKFLNTFSETQVATAGPGSPGQETDYFGSLTFAAVFAFQALYADEILKPVGLLNPTGYWGPSTIAQANSLSGCN